MRLTHFLPTRLANRLRRLRGSWHYRRDWNHRIADVLRCPENHRIPRVPGAGRVKGGWQTMHNGLLTSVHGYYGSGMTRLLKANKGCHEPQEEVVFAEVLNRLHSPASMIECGAYWAFYSMWFLQKHPEGKAFMIEPDQKNLKVGMNNFSKNGLSGFFEHAGVGESPESGSTSPPIVSIPSFMAKHGLEAASILHLDIQGAEYAALKGALPLLKEQRFQYVFVSTHSEELHADCHRLLSDSAYALDISVPPASSFSFDGVIVARSPVADPVHLGK